MKFKDRNLRKIAEMVVGDAEYFHYRSSKYITMFFEECDLDFVHDGSTRPVWAAERLAEVLLEPQTNSFSLPDRFLIILRTLMDLREATENDPDRTLALESLNKTLCREGYEAYFADDRLLHVRHVQTQTISSASQSNPHRPFSSKENERKEQLSRFLARCSEDELIEDILLPLFRQLSFHRITAAGHKDKSLEYGKDVWMRYTLPTQHVLYIGLQAKKGKIDSAGVSKSSQVNVAELYNQALMMLGHEVFDPELNRRVLVDHAFIVSGGEITKQARNWIGGKLDASKRSQIMFMDRDDILNLFIVNQLPLPKLT
jgi:hypothetical protein